MRINISKLERALRRERKKKNRAKMVVDGRSIFTIVEKQKEKSEELRRARRRKEKANE